MSQPEKTYATIFSTSIDKTWAFSLYPEREGFVMLTDFSAELSRDSHWNGSVWYRPLALLEHPFEDVIRCRRVYVLHVLFESRVETEIGVE